MVTGRRLEGSLADSFVPIVFVFYGNCSHPRLLLKETFSSHDGIHDVV